MNITKNVGALDQAVRLVLAEVFFIGGFFWTYGVLQIIVYVLALVMLVTALARFCGIYAIIGVSTCPAKEKPTSKIKLGSFLVALLLIAVSGSYYSNFFTKKFFLEDYNKMNQFYKQALFFTGQEKREEAGANYQSLVSEYGAFLARYHVYHPYVISGDGKFNADLDTISAMIETPKEKIATGNLKSAHVDLEQIRPIFQDILKRNGFSILAVALVDFHDAMEKIIAPADAKNVQLVIDTYPEVNEKLKAVEEGANDAEIQAIRKNLEDLVSLAREGKSEALSTKAAELKSSFVKVYLKRG